MFKEKPLTCKELSVQHVDSFVFPWVLALEVNGVQGVFNEGGEHHGHQNCVLREEREKAIKKAKQRERVVFFKQVLCIDTRTGLHKPGVAVLKTRCVQSYSA